MGEAWEAVIDAFGEANWPIEEMERASGFIIAGIDCGRGQGLAQTGDCGVRFNVVVREEGVGETEIT